MKNLAIVALDKGRVERGLRRTREQVCRLHLEMLGKVDLGPRLGVKRRRRGFPRRLERDALLVRLSALRRDEISLLQDRRTCREACDVLEHLEEIRCG